MRGVLPYNFNALMTPTGRIQPTLGPLCRSSRDVTSVMRVIFDPETHLKYDIYVAPSPFREDLYKKTATPGKIKVGYWESLPTVPASAPNVRAARMAKEALIKQGYEVVDFALTKAEIQEYAEVLTTLALNYVLIPGLKVLENNYESVIPQYRAIKMLVNYGPVFRFLLKSVLSLTGNSRIREAIEPVAPRSFAYLHELMRKQTVLQK